MASKAKVVLAALLLATLGVQAQQASLFVLDTNTLAQSLYDVRRVTDSTCYAVGEEGARAVINTKTKAIVYTYDSSKEHIIELIWANGKWQAPPPYEANIRRAQYASHQFGSELYSAYFHSNILVPRVAIPNGKMYRTTGGKVRVKRYWGSTIWQFFEHGHQLYCLKYNLLGTRILQLSKGMRSIAQKRYRYLLHKCSIADSQQAFCGATNFKLSTGVLVYNNVVYKLPKSGMLWDCAITPHHVVCAGSTGKVFVLSKATLTWQVLDAKIPRHFYDMVVFDNTHVLLVGQAGLAAICTL